MTQLWAILHALISKYYSNWRPWRHLAFIKLMWRLPDAEWKFIGDKAHIVVTYGTWCRPCINIGWTYLFKDLRQNYIFEMWTGFYYRCCQWWTGTNWQQSLKSRWYCIFNIGSSVLYFMYMYILQVREHNKKARKEAKQNPNKSKKFTQPCKQTAISAKNQNVSLHIIYTSTKSYCTFSVIQI